MTSTNENWACTVPGCMRDNRACDRLAGVPTDADADVKIFKYPESGAAYCADYIDWLIDSKKFNDAFESAPTAEDTEAETDAAPLTPTVILARLKERVQGQDRACQSIASAIFEQRKNRELRTEHKDLLDENDLDDEDVSKANIFMPGPTGCGKTYIVKTVAKIVDEPFYVYRGTAGLTAAGYVGGNVEDIVEEYVAKVQEWLEARNDPAAKDPRKVAEWINTNGGIIAVDEVDKIAASKGTGKDVGGQAVQDRLLTFMEGEEITIKLPHPSNPQAAVQVTVDTTHIQFILMGAFSPAGDGKDKMSQRKLIDIIKQRRGSTGSGMEGRADESSRVADGNLYLYAKEEDFVSFGFKPEFVGRIMGYFAPLRQLGEEDLVRILTHVRGNPVAVEKARYSILGSERGLRGFNLKFTDDALKAIAKKAASKGTGARGLKTVLRQTLSEIGFMAPDLVGEYDEILITADIVETEGVIVKDGDNQTFRKSGRKTLTPVDDKPDNDA